MMDNYIAMNGDEVYCYGLLLHLIRSIVLKQWVIKI